jgi:hypothetical protein
MFLVTKEAVSNAQNKRNRNGFERKLASLQSTLLHTASSRNRTEIEN